MRLTRGTSRTYKGVQYTKLRLRLTVSQELAEALGWSEGDEMEAVRYGEGVLIRRSRGSPKKRRS